MGCGMTGICDEIFMWTVYISNYHMLAHASGIDSGE